MSLSPTARNSRCMPAGNAGRRPRRSTTGDPVVAGRSNLTAPVWRRVPPAIGRDLPRARRRADAIDDREESLEFQVRPYGSSLPVAHYDTVGTVRIEADPGDRRVRWLRW